MNLKRNEQGFTIIEVVLVLAIAGLIFLMVFIAYPALSRSRQDTQRREDLSRVSSQLTSYMTNNNGKLPSNSTSTSSATSFGSFVDRYMKVDGDTFEDPVEGEYSLDTNSGGSEELEVGVVQYIRGATCEGENATGDGTTRQAALRTKLAGSGHYCLDVK